MTIYALIRPDNTVDRRDGNVDPTVKTRAGFRWLPVEKVDPSYDPFAQVREGPVTTVEASRVLDTFTIRNKTAPEFDAEKAARIDNATAQDLLTIVLTLENDNRIIKAKLNQLITDTAASTAKFTAGQVAQITMAQLKTALKALL